MGLRIGIDVGSTHTDAVILDEQNRLVHAVKTATTPDPTDGILQALHLVLKQSGVDPEEVDATMFGTTHCTNAIVERRNLARIGLLRLAKPATMAIKPFRPFPPAVRDALGNTWAIVPGGHEYDGREIASLDEQAVREAARHMKQEKVEAVAICGVFSPVNQAHEKAAAQIVQEELGPQTPITLSHELGSIGLLERENAAALNAAVVKVADRAISAFHHAMQEAKLTRAALYLTQNDGTLMSLEYARRYPIRTIASGPTNSIRGAIHLTDQRDAIIVDVGGTTTLVGVAVKGFPRESAVAVEIGGVRTNFRMPDLVAISCGGGTVVKGLEGDIRLGPESVGYNLVMAGRAWGGPTLTTTDVALAAGYASIDDPRCNPQNLQGLDPKLVEGAVQVITQSIENAVERIKTRPDPMPLVLVGGGGIIMPPDRYSKLKGVSHVYRPDHFQYANAIGAAIAQVSGEVDRIFSLDNTTRAQVLNQAKEAATNEAIKAGAAPSSVEVVEVDEIPLAYLPGNAIRVRVKAVGRLTL